MQDVLRQVQRQNLELNKAKCSIWPFYSRRPWGLLRLPRPPGVHRPTMSATPHTRVPGVVRRRRLRPRPTGPDAGQGEGGGGVTTLGGPPGTRRDGARGRSGGPDHEEGGRSVICGDHVSRVWKPVSMLAQIHGCGWCGVAYLYSRGDAFKKFPKKTENQMRQTMGKINQISISQPVYRYLGTVNSASVGSTGVLKT